jgi:hypothetical protein
MKKFLLLITFTTFAFSKVEVDCYTLSERKCLTYPDECQVLDTDFEGVYTYDEKNFCLKEERTFIGCIQKDENFRVSKTRNPNFMSLAIFKKDEKTILLNELRIWLANSNLDWKMDLKLFQELLFHYQEKMKFEGKWYSYPETCK